MPWPWRCRQSAQMSLGHWAHSLQCRSMEVRYRKKLRLHAWTPRGTYGVSPDPGLTSTCLHPQSLQQLMRTHPNVWIPAVSSDVTQALSSQRCQQHQSSKAAKIQLKFQPHFWNHVDQGDWLRYSAPPTRVGQPTAAHLQTSERWSHPHCEPSGKKVVGLTLLSKCALARGLRWSTWAGPPSCLYLQCSQGCIQILSPWCCLPTASPSPFSWYFCWNLSFSTQPLCIPAGARLRLWTAANRNGQGPRSSSLLARHRLIATLCSEPVKFLPVLADLPAVEGGSQSEGTSPVSWHPPRGAGPMLNPFCFPLPLYVVTWWSFLQVYYYYKL